MISRTVRTIRSASIALCFTLVCVLYLAHGVQEVYASSDEEVTISVSIYPTGAGRVTGGGTFSKFDWVTLEAFENSGWMFEGWYEDGRPSGWRPAWSFQAQSSINLQARFTRVYTITTTVYPANAGRVTQVGVHTPYNDQADLLAIPNSGWEFAGWYEGGRRVFTGEEFWGVFFTSDRTLQARFVREEQPPPPDIPVTIIATAHPANGGRVYGIEPFLQGESVFLTPYPNDGWEFIGWYEGGNRISTSWGLSFIAQSNRTLQARFSQVPRFTITVSAQPPSGGNVSRGGTFTRDELVVIYAEPHWNYGWRFDGWYEGNIRVYSSDVYGFYARANRTLVARFSHNRDVRFNISVSAHPSYGGRVYGGGAGNRESSRMVLAVPADGWQFDGWYESGVRVTGREDITFTVVADRTLQARFSRVQQDAVTTAPPTPGPAQGSPVIVPTPPTIGAVSLPFAQVAWASGQTVTAAISGHAIQGAVRNIDIGMVVSLRIVAENLLGTEPGWVGLNQPITISGMNAAGQHMTVIVTQGQPTASITVGGQTRTVDMAEEATRLSTDGWVGTPGNVTVRTIEGAAFLTLRFILAVFEIPFRWDSPTQSVIIG